MDGLKLFNGTHAGIWEPDRRSVAEERDNECFIDGNFGLLLLVLVSSSFIFFFRMGPGGGAGGEGWEGGEDGKAPLETGGLRRPESY